MNDLVLRPVATNLVDEAWLEVLERRLRAEIAIASAGQCLRLEGLPRLLLEQLAERLGADSAAETYLVDRHPGPEPWRVGVHKVVERRNAGSSVVVAIIPPDLRLAAGDSVDVSTFRLVPTGALEGAVAQELLSGIPSALGNWVEAVLAYLQRRNFAIPQSGRLRYIATIGHQGTDELAVVGGALFVLGLVPDFGLLDRPEDFQSRLGQRNLAMLEILRDATKTPIERVLRLPLTDQRYREGLHRLFAVVPPDDVEEWGRRVACDPEWRSLSLDRWPLEGALQPTDTIRIDVATLKLPRREDGLLVCEPSSRVNVQWEVAPDPIDVPALAHFRLELLNSDRVVAWESPLYRSDTGKTRKRSRFLKDLQNVESGVYFVRVVALNDAGDSFPHQPLRDPDAGDRGKRTNETEDFLLLAIDEPVEVEGTEAVTDLSARSFSDAEIQAKWTALLAGRSVETVKPQDVSWETPASATGETAIGLVRFDLQRQYALHLSQRLRRIEMSILATPQDGGHRRALLGRRYVEPEAIQLRLPPGFARIRAQVFGSIRETAVRENGSAVVALADLCQLGASIEEYARAYAEWLDERDPDALRVDLVHAELPEGGSLALVAPTHPLRLLWLLQEHQLARSWSTEASTRGSIDRGILNAWRTRFVPLGLPGLVVLGPIEGYVEATAFPGGWGAYLPPNLTDSRSTMSLLAARLGSAASRTSDADVSPHVIADKLELFLQQHAYTSSLVMNIVNAGDARVVVDALVDLEARLAERGREIRYEVRLFTERAVTGLIGSALRELADPERQVSEAAAALAGPGRSFLFPKLTWSRRPLRALLEHPDDFQAHVTLVLDAFPIALRIARPHGADRSSFVHGLIQDSARRFVGRGAAYSWVRRPAPTDCVDVVEAPGRSGLIAILIGRMAAAQARLLAPTAAVDNEAFAATALDLSSASQSLLYAAHAASTWVLTLDAHLGLDYFDAAGRSDAPGYLLDFTPEFVSSGGRRLLLTTRAVDEVARLMKPATNQIGLDDSGPGPELLIEALRSLSGRIAMRLLSSPNQVQGALGMALSRLFLEGYGLLSDVVVVPLDAHPELVEPHADPFVPKLRGDLLVVGMDPSTRHLEFLLVEAKCLAGVGLGQDLRERIESQLSATEDSLRHSFAPGDERRIDYVLQTWQLTQILDFYLDRARRYRLVKPDEYEALHKFVLDLDSGYSMSFRKLGLVFRLGAADTFLDQNDRELPIWIVGRDVVQRLVAEAMRSFVSPGTETAASSMTDDETWEDVRRTFVGTRSSQQKDSLPRHAPVHRSEDLVTVAPEEPIGQPARVVASEELRKSDRSADVQDEHKSETEPSTDVPLQILLGDVHQTLQHGLLGFTSAEPSRRVALDLDGCNTISVFGVQGGGKSYTVGAIIEMATRRLAAINTLPQPLAAVVFHYHQTQDYPPEYLSMVTPNDVVAEVQELAALGARPANLSDVLLLTTSDTVARRRLDYPHLQVRPIQFSSSELTISDWRFLMGAVGNEALYIRILNEVMRKDRNDLTFERIRRGLQAADLTDSQRRLATTRLDFASRFIDDRASLRDLVRPGRLLVIDVRDEFMDREQALGLFVTMLNIISAAGMGEEPFNKIIVFDEAHKYMDGSVIGSVVEIIREMRHKGTSVVVASQDPVNVPAELIELSSVVALHRFNSPSWLKHIQKALAGFDQLTPPMIASLSPGEAYMWANRATDSAFTKRAVKVKVRPRVTKHGGVTRTAT